MQGWFSQILIGLIVTIVGTVLADALVSRHRGRGFLPGFHHAGQRDGGSRDSGSRENGSRSPGR